MQLLVKTKGNCRTLKISEGQEFKMPASWLNDLAADMAMISIWFLRLTQKTSHPFSAFITMSTKIFISMKVDCRTGFLTEALRLPTCRLHGFKLRWVTYFFFNILIFQDWINMYLTYMQLVGMSGITFAFLFKMV